MKNTKMHKTKTELPNFVTNFSNMNEPIGTIAKIANEECETAPTSQKETFFLIFFLVYVQIQSGTQGS